MNKRNYGYKNCNSENGTFSCHIKKETNTKLDIYCRINGINKTAFVNEMVDKKMEEMFSKLKEDSHE